MSVPRKLGCIRLPHVLGIPGKRGFIFTSGCLPVTTVCKTCTAQLQRVMGPGVGTGHATSVITSLLNRNVIWLDGDQLPPGPAGRQAFHSQTGMGKQNSILCECEAH